MISLRTRKYHLTDPLFRKVIGENAIRAHVLIKPSISHGITGIRRLSVLGDLVSQGRGMWRLGTLGQRPAGAPGRPLRGCRRRGARRPGSSGPCHPFVRFGRLPLCALWRGRNPGRWPDVSEVVPRPGQVPLSWDLRLRETEARQGRPRPCMAREQCVWDPRPLRLPRPRPRCRERLEVPPAAGRGLRPLGICRASLLSVSSSENWGPFSGDHLE